MCTQRQYSADFNENLEVLSNFYVLNDITGGF